MRGRGPGSPIRLLRRGAGPRCYCGTWTPVTSMRGLLVAGARWVPLARLALLLAAASGLHPPFAEYLVVGEGARMRTVAIACQGGGSHTAFTGGALQRLLGEGQYRIVALSGTSGGAVCALLAW